MTTEPAGPTRYVTPEEFNVGTNYVGGCPKCKGQLLGPLGRWLEGHRWVKPGRMWRTPLDCRFCQGWGTALYVKQPDGTFKPQRVPRQPV